MTQAYAAARFADACRPFRNCAKRACVGLTRAKAQLETEERAGAQQQAARAVREALADTARGLDVRTLARPADSRKQWTEAVSRLCEDRLPGQAPGASSIRAIGVKQSRNNSPRASGATACRPIFEAAGDVAERVFVSALIRRCSTQLRKACSPKAYHCRADTQRNRTKCCAYRCRLSGERR